MKKQILPAPKQALSILAALVLLIAFSGCVQPPPAGQPFQPQQQAPGNATGNVVSVQTPPAQPPVQANASVTKGVKYQNVLSFHNFTDPREGAFSLDVPDGWAVTNGSGLIRPYIDAGVVFGAKSPQGQMFFFQDPYGYIYATPNQLLNLSGFGEGSLYDPSGGFSKPMMVKRYMRAPEFASALLAGSSVHPVNVKTSERPDLILQTGNPLITQQSASETTFDYFEAEVKSSGVLVVRTMLLENSGTGLWSASVMEYESPAALMNETEMDALVMQRSFKVDAAWAARENQEVRKRLGIISAAQSDIAATISAAFEFRSSTMDEINKKWGNAMLGVEDVYDPDTGAHYVVDSGSRYYWSDAQGNIYGTDTAGSPMPGEDLHPLKCPGC